MYYLLSGEYPFMSTSSQGMYEKICEGRFNTFSLTWDWISEEAKDLIKKLLEVDPDKRFIASQAFKHQ